MHWVGVRIPRGMIGTKSGKKKNLHFGYVL